MNTLREGVKYKNTKHSAAAPSIAL